MANKTNFWAIFVVPWSPKNRYRFALYVLVGTYLIFVLTWLVNYFASGQVPSVPLWWLFFPIGISAFLMLIFWIIGLLVENTGKKLPEGAQLRSHCMVVHGLLEAPGVVQISSDHLVIQPFMCRQISVALSDIAAVTEYHYYNGRPYLGKTVFFKLKVPRTVSDKWRLGFGVEDGDRWRKVLLAKSNTT